ncbi:hypothetical protein FAES_0868 [Fibrella aestuarina BUZ 2]|uniref:DUF58 domain-containing protein n=1 Tax=Fibrella aestuarina BUZ 2 TaxID=1166018 RepID=I0K426_9BACT|nr:DUF58 domain-containing protein [Fibrella aestuarina]CCG98879.1 hypothetical protein FAES_0868 [Fibrella aestuarina BUZ 2]
MNDFLIRAREFEIRIRKAVSSQMRGNFRSVFKGSGLEFADLRPYQYGDDVRAIDWNVSSKGHGAFVKVFREEKDQTVFFMVDVSASQQVGSFQRSKLDTTKDVCGALAMSAINEASHVGMYCFSDQKEKYMKPANTLKQGYQMITALGKLEPQSVKTNVADALLFTMNVLKRRSLIFLLSDFIDQGYEHNLKALARKHDLVVIHFYDPREINLPKLGVVPVFDTELRQTVWLNTSAPRFRNALREQFAQSRTRLERLCRQYDADYVALDAQADFVPTLAELFRARKYR